MAVNDDNIKALEEILRLIKMFNRHPTMYEFSSLSRMTYNTARNLYPDMTWKEIINEALKCQ